MAETTQTTYMLLVLPTPEEQIGPDWAQNLVTALQRIDLHDHTSDLGVKITPAALEINDDVDFDNNLVENAEAVTLVSQASTDSTPGKIYRVGPNLYYNNAAGTPVQITSGSSVNAAGTGAISASAPASYPYTVVTGDAQKVLLINTTSARTINLPAATNSLFFMIKDISGQSQTNNISIVPNGTDIIDGLNSTYLVRENYASIGLVSDGVSAWYVV